MNIKSWPVSAKSWLDDTMLDRSGLRRAWKPCKAASDESRRIMAEARRTMTPLQLQALQSLRMFEEDEACDGYLARLTRNLLGDARKRHIMVPPRPQMDAEETDSWNVNQFGTWYLTSTEGDRIRGRMREHRRATQSFWAQMIAAATGIIGATAGLVAVIYALVQSQSSMPSP